MSIIKSYSVGNGDMFYIRHNSDSFTIIDCNLTGPRDDEIINEIKSEIKANDIVRFISTHPDQDHFSGIEKLDGAVSIPNFYCVQNRAVKAPMTASFSYYCGLRDSQRAFYLRRDVARAWLTKNDHTRGSAGFSILWPNTDNVHYVASLRECNAGVSYNNVSSVIRYGVNGGASVLWLGDLETDFMESIVDDIELTKTTIVFASHHGRHSGKIPDSWLQKLDPQIIVIGEAPSRHLNYYTGYKKITQNRAGDIIMDLVGNKVHFYVSNPDYKRPELANEYQMKFPNYVGSITVETEYTL